MRKLSRLLIVLLLFSFVGAVNPGPSPAVRKAKAAEPRLVVFEAYYSTI